MFVDERLWALTKGARGAIARCVAIGVAASVSGIVRLGLLGWLLSKVFDGSDASELTGPIFAVAAAMIVRGALEHWRKMVAHHTAASVQMEVEEVDDADGALPHSADGWQWGGGGSFGGGGGGGTSPPLPAQTPAPVCAYVWGQVGPGPGDLQVWDAAVRKF